MAQTFTDSTFTNIGPASINSVWVDCGDADAVSFHVSVTANADAEGTWTIVGTNDTSATAVNMPFSADGGAAVTSVALAAAATDTHLFGVYQPFMRYVRLVHTRSAGSASGNTADLYINIQGTNG